MRVLVVDDDRAVRDALRRALTLGGYEVQSAEDGEQALEQVVQAVPDAVVLDVGLPGSTAWRSAAGCACWATACRS